MNCIRGLLNLQGLRHIDPNGSNWENELVNLRAGDGRSLPRQRMNEVHSEGKLLGTVRDFQPTSRSDRGKDWQTD
jgi:hypothetical protein